MVFAEPDVIAHNSTMTIEDADTYLFGLLHSSMWMAWVRAIGGRLESRYRISASLVYNTFPWPDDPSASRRSSVVEAAQGVIDLRAAYSASSLADLYDPLVMPSDLTSGHVRLDRAVDALYGRGSFDEITRLAMLLRRYEALTTLTVPRRRHS